VDIHPWARYEIAQARHEERVARGITAYHALRATEEHGSDPPAEAGAIAPQVRLLDRLLRREAGSARASVETVP